MSLPLELYFVSQVGTINMAPLAGHGEIDSLIQQQWGRGEEFFQSPDLLPWPSFTENDAVFDLSSKLWFDSSAPERWQPRSSCEPGFHERGPLIKKEDYGNAY